MIKLFKKNSYIYFSYIIQLSTFCQNFLTLDT